MIKTINLVLEDAGIRLESNNGSDLITVRLNGFVLDEKQSKKGHEFYKESEVVEVYPSVEEVKVIIKALQQILPEDEEL